MYSYRTLVLFPQTNDYSSIHEWPLISALKTHSYCTLESYIDNKELTALMHSVANDRQTRLIFVFGTDTQWAFLNAALVHHPQCRIIESNNPCAFYARINESTHLLGLTLDEETLSFAQSHATLYLQSLSEQPLIALSKQVQEELKRTQLTISCAESCTGGLISKTLTDISGASAYFNGGVCTYTADAKTKILSVPPQTIKEEGIVSAETAIAMAVGSQRLFRTNIALSTTGVAGPGPDSDGNPEGLVYCCIAMNNDTYVYKYLATNANLFTDRTFIRHHCVKFILENLLEMLRTF